MKNACQVLFAQYHDCKKLFISLHLKNDKKEEFYGIIFHIKMLFFIPVIIPETAETRFYEIYSVIRPFQGFHDPYVFPALHRDADCG